MPKYEYDRNFQIDVLKLLVQSPTLLCTNYGAIKAKYFTESDLQILVRFVLEFFDEYHKPPTMSEIKTLITDYVSDAEQTYYANLVYSIYTDKLNADSKFIEKSVTDFGGMQALCEVAIDITDLIEEGVRDGGISEVYSKARNLVDEAMLVGTTKSGGLDINDFLCHENFMKMIDDSQIYVRRIKTLIPSFDSITGGIGRRELGVVVAPSGMGKTTVLVNFGVGALVSGNKVLFVSLECKDADIMGKYLSRITSMSVDEMMKNKEAYEENVGHFKEFLNRDMAKVEYFKTKNFGIGDLRNLLNHLYTAHKFSPDLLIIDYADRMKVERDYDALGNLYDELIQIAEDYNFAIWTASQANRKASYEDVKETNASHMADSYLKVANADIILTLSQTAAEKSANLLRMTTVKSRRSEDSYRIKCSIDYGRCVIKEEHLIKVQNSE